MLGTPYQVLLRLPLVPLCAGSVKAKHTQITRRSMSDDELVKPTKVT